MLKIFLSVAALAVSFSSVSAQISYPGNGQVGFGGAIGTGSLSLSDDGTTLSGVLTRGSGTFNNGFVIYIDSITGTGADSTAGFTDFGDDLRKAISGFDGTSRATLAFPTGFAADFALAMSPAAEFGGLWDLTNTSSFGFVNPINFAPASDQSATNYSFSINIADLGLTANTAQSFTFLSTYISFDAYRSNESIGTTLSGTPAEGDPNGNFGRNPVSADNFLTYTTIPEPSTVSLLGASALFAGCFYARRRRR